MNFTKEMEDFIESAVRNSKINFEKVIEESPYLGFHIASIKAVINQSLVDEYFPMTGISPPAIALLSLYNALISIKILGGDFDQDFCQIAQDFLSLSDLSAANQHLLVGKLAELANRSDLQLAGFYQIVALCCVLRTVLELEIRKEESEASAKKQAFPWPADFKGGLE